MMPLHGMCTCIRHLGNVIMHKLHELDEAIVVVSCWSCFMLNSTIQCVCVCVCGWVGVCVWVYLYLLITYKQTWEMFFVDVHSKGEGSDSISRCPELTFTLVHACNAIGPGSSTVDSVTTLGLVHTHTHMYTHMYTHTYTHTHTHTHTSTQSLYQTAR